jgi:hypothetical protein
MITQDMLVEKILAHLNDEMTEAELVHWAEDALVLVSESDDDLANEEAILDVLAYLGAGDTPGFPLSWTVLSGFLARFGVKVRVVSTAA